MDTDPALDIGNDTEHLLQDVQGTLADLAGMAQQLSQQKQEALKQQESLESLQTQLHEKERQLQEKEKQLRQWHKRLQDDRQALERETEQSNRLLAERSAACNNSRKASKPASAAARGEPRYCRSNRNASKSCAASRTCARPNWKARSQRPAAQPGTRRALQEAGKRPREAGADRQGFQRDRTVQYRSARHQSYRVEAPGRERSRTGIRFSSGKGRGADTGPRPFHSPSCVRPPANTGVALPRPGYRALNTARVAGRGARGCAH